MVIIEVTFLDFCFGNIYVRQNLWFECRELYGSKLDTRERVHNDKYEKLTGIFWGLTIAISVDIVAA